MLYQSSLLKEVVTDALFVARGGSGAKRTVIIFSRGEAVILQMVTNAPSMKQDQKFHAKLLNAVGCIIQRCQYG